MSVSLFGGRRPSVQLPWLGFYFAAGQEPYGAALVFMVGVGAGERLMSIEPYEVVWARALSPRELDVALLVARGLPNKAVARALRVAEGTVKIHLYSVFRKLGATNRSALLLQTRKNTELSA
jgi:DNA-binding CsgD family transcriptional regulator